MHEMWRAGRLTEREPGGRCPGPGAMGVSLSSVSVEVMNTESGADGTTSSRELMPLIHASKRGVLWYANYNSIKLFSLKNKNKNRHIPPSALRTHPVCAPSGRKLTSQHRGQAVLQEPPLHRRRDCRTRCPGERKGAGAGARRGFPAPRGPLPLDLCMTSAGKTTPDVARQRPRSSVALFLLFPWEGFPT